MEVNSIQLDEGPDLPDDFYLYTLTFADPNAPKPLPSATAGDDESGDEEAPSYTFGL
jgi:hypothetical protein